MIFIVVVIFIVCRTVHVFCEGSNDTWKTELSKRQHVMPPGLHVNISSTSKCTYHAGVDELLYCKALS